jgi:hypothetical protein
MPAICTPPKMCGDRTDTLTFPDCQIKGPRLAGRKLLMSLALRHFARKGREVGDRAGGRPRRVMRTLFREDGALSARDPLLPGCVDAAKVSGIQKVAGSTRVRGHRGRTTSLFREQPRGATPGLAPCLRRGPAPARLRCTGHHGAQAFPDAPSHPRAGTCRSATAVRCPSPPGPGVPILAGMAPPTFPDGRSVGPARPVHATRIEAALRKVAAPVAQDAVLAPVFERLEAELARAMTEERQATAVQARALALLARGQPPPQGQSAIRRTTSARCSSDAPLPYRSRSSR